MNINRSELMTLAWTFARREHWSRRMPSGTLRSLFPAALKAAWKHLKGITARRAARLAELAHMSLDALKAEAITLQNKSFLGHEGRQRLTDVQRAISDIEARDRQEKRALIEIACGRICSVTFEKADGSTRVMKV